MRRKVAAKVGDARGDAARGHRPARAADVPAARLEASAEAAQVEGAPRSEQCLAEDQPAAEADPRGREREECRRLGLAEAAEALEALAEAAARVLA